ncbi:MAG: hypothetical protein KGL39_08735 [Patescibacteria group bacterium]|nr:hypothetical protein [Patescibacteria group bacterium]
MNKNVYVASVRLLGKLVAQYEIKPEDYRGIERELIEQAIRDSQFFGTTDLGEKAHQATVVAAGAKRKPGRPPKGV